MCWVVDVEVCGRFEKACSLMIARSEWRMDGRVVSCYVLYYIPNPTSVVAIPTSGTVCVSARNDAFKPTKRLVCSRLVTNRIGRGSVRRRRGRAKGKAGANEYAAGITRCGNHAGIDRRRYWWK